jgi:ubiquinol-cytochrome c reductase cytochrome b subunit
MRLPASRSIAQDIGLFVVLAIIADGVILPGLRSPEVPALPALDAFHQAAIVQVMATLYVGTFGAVRTVTWLLLIGAWAGSQIAGFASYVLPLNQFSGLGTVGPTVAGLWPVAALLVLALDIAVTHMATPRRHAGLSFAMLFGAAIMVALITRVPLSAFDLAVLADARSYRDFDIVPAWHALPFYAMLRAVPVKALGVAVAFAALLAPMIWPWVHADRLRVGRIRWAWRLAWMMFAATAIGLGWLGARPPDTSTILATRILTVGYFGYFLVVPFALRRVARDTP